ncbi:MAG: FKBP-type peptidyl-prolyl cis-trans isomerase [Myxococcales bacterium]
MRIAAVIALALAACGPSAPPTIEQTTFAPALGVNLAASTKLAGGLYFRDLEPGTGPGAVFDQTVSAYYTGWLADGAQFDSNVSNGKPQFSFVLGIGQVIDGWDLGLVGAKAGGTRQLIIGPEYGYGSIGRGAIPPNAILVFNVQLVSVQ